MPTKILADADNGNVRAELDWDASLRVVTLRVINNTAQACYLSVTQTSNGRTRGQRFPPNDTTVLTIPTTVAQRIQGQLDPRNRFNGVEFAFIWPYP